MTELLFSTKTLPGPDDITREEFSNGSVLLTRPNMSSPAVAIKGYLPPGSSAEKPEKYGLANFMSSMLTAGTWRHAFRELHDEIESMGASLSIGAGGLATSFSANCLREDLPRLLALIREVFSEPSFPIRQVRRIKTQLLTFLAIQAQDTAAMADQAFDRAIYGSHPYAIPELGFPHTLQRISREDLEDFQQRYLGPKGMVVAICGGVLPAEALAAFSQTLGVWVNAYQQPQPELPPVQALHGIIREHVTLEEKSQTDLVLGTFAPKTTGPDYLPAQLGNEILGQFGMMGRIGESVREKAGLAYYAQSELGSGIGPTTWQVIAGVNPRNLDKAVALIREELARFTSEPVSEEELADVRSALIGQLPLSMESNAGVAGALLNLERYQHGLNYYRELPARISSVTREDILRTAQTYWQLENLVIASAGVALS
ncbi:MAG TPA: pitrilysin family protein [Anaerolineaceae bacterium]|nr:pitrilysin family protein [Anaerolineaceae bacterium]